MSTTTPEPDPRPHAYLCKLLVAGPLNTRQARLRRALKTLLRAYDVRVATIRPEQWKS
jgi:hypothetical protein